MKNFSTFIRKRRIELGLRTLDVAQYLGIDQALISKYENGKRNPTEIQVIKLAEILKIDLEQIQVLYKKEQIFKYLQNDSVSLKAINMVQEELAKYNRIVPIKYSKDLSKVLAQIDERKEKLNQLRHLDSYRISEALEMEYTFESNKIEGNTLTLQETDLVINEGLTVSGKSMREHLEAINHSDAINFVKDLIAKKSVITESIILQIHNLILRGISAEYAGKYRNVQVMIKGSKHIPPQAFLVPKTNGGFNLLVRK